MADQAVLTGAGWLPVVAPHREDGGAEYVELASPLSREDPDLGLATYDAGTEYDFIAASTTRLLMGTSQLGDLLSRLVIVVTTSATSQVQIRDGADPAITIFPNNMPVGVHQFPIGAISRAGGWTVITAAGSAVWASGAFA